MTKKILSICIFVLAGAAAFGATATAGHQVQLNVPEIVLMDLNSVTTITLNVVAPAQGGLNPTGQTDASKHLWYTAINAGVTRRTISVSWGGGDGVPAGTHLQVEATSVTAGAGSPVVGGRTLSGVAQTIVTAIPSCVTGQGANGATITYSLAVDTPASLVVGDNHLITVTFTLSDAS